MHTYSLGIQTCCIQNKLDKHHQGVWDIKPTQSHDIVQRWNHGPDIKNIFSEGLFGLFHKVSTEVGPVMLL